MKVKWSEVSHSVLVFKKSSIWSTLKKDQFSIISSSPSPLILFLSPLLYIPVGFGNRRRRCHAENMCRGFDPLLAKCITSSSHFNELPIFNLRQCLMREANTVKDYLHLPGLDRGLQVQVWGTAEKRFDNKCCFSSFVIRTSLMSPCGHLKLSCDCGPALCGVNFLTVHKPEFPSFIRHPSDAQSHQITIQQSEQW